MAKLTIRILFFYFLGWAMLINGTNFGDGLSGGSADDSIYGGAGQDTVFGEAGADLLRGGNDNDQIFGGVGNDSLFGMGGNDLLTGNSGDDWFVGGDGGDGYFGGAGDDTFFAEPLDTFINGGDGSDTYVIYNTGNSNRDWDYPDIFEEDGAPGTDHVITDSAINLGTGSQAAKGGGYIENLSIVGDAPSPDNLNFDTRIVYMNGLDNVVRVNGQNVEVFGFGGDDLLDARRAPELTFGGREFGAALNGERGNDTLLGSSSNDTLNPGEGVDLLSGGDGNDWYRLSDNRTVKIIESGGGGTDLVTVSYSYKLPDAIENLGVVRAIGSSEALVGVGNAGDNDMTTGPGGTLRGLAGNDTLTSYYHPDAFVEPEDITRLLGGSGDDYYIVRSPDSVVIEGANRGIDTVAASSRYKLSAHVENLILTDVSLNPFEDRSANGIGNGLDNTITGNDGENWLIGREGNDTLEGQGGADIFIFDRALGDGNVDHIVDFNVGSGGAGDMLKLKGIEFGSMAAGSLASNALGFGAAASTADHRFVFNQATGQLWFDEDGSGAAEKVLVATFGQSASLSVSDFEIF